MTMKERITNFEEGFATIKKAEEKIKKLIQEEKERMIGAKEIPNMIQSLVTILQLEIAIENMNVALEEGDILGENEIEGSIPGGHELYEFLDYSLCNELSGDCETLKMLLKALKKPSLQYLY